MRKLDMRQLRFALFVVIAASLAIAADAAELTWIDTPLGKAILTGTGFPAPAVISRVNPKLPGSEVHSSNPRMVRLEVLVDQKGNVFSTRVLQASSDRLGEAVRDAVRRWVYKPTTVDGKSVPALAHVEFRFQN